MLLASFGVVCVLFALDKCRFVESVNGDWCCSVAFVAACMLELQCFLFFLLDLVILCLNIVFIVHRCLLVAKIVEIKCLNRIGVAFDRVDAVAELKT